MRSEFKAVQGRFGAVLTASMSVLLVEAVIGMMALVVFGWTQESPGAGYNAMNAFFLVLLVPVLAVVGAVVGALVSVGAVMPLLVAAGWLGRLVTGRADWWWAPAVAAGVVVVPVFGGALVVEAGPLGALGAWLAATAALAAPALVARRLLLPDRRAVTGGAMFGWVTLYGTLAVVTTFTLLGGGLYTGIIEEYRPPQLSAERVAGTWSDDEGGTLTLAPDGTATLAGVATYDFEDFSHPELHHCSGVGRWTYDPGENPWDQEVEVSAGACELPAWSVMGSPERPKLYYYIGDPDAWNLSVLERRS